MIDGPITQDQYGCARCDTDRHPNMTYEPLTYPIPLRDGWTATHWAPCPTNGQPILLAHEDRDVPRRPTA